MLQLTPIKNSCNYYKPLLLYFSCWIAVGAGDKGAIWAFVVPMLLVVLVRSLYIAYKCIGIIVVYI